MVLQKGNLGQGARGCTQLGSITWVLAFLDREGSNAAAAVLSEEAQELVKGQEHWLCSLDPIFFQWLLLQVPWLSARPGAAFAL